ncbi:MAG: hypothetical protein QOG33_421 [Gaiellales bacterium]|jgi:hypothetical protein|nr:hypothetical protein [Gaiellales bacterium]
MSFDPQNSLLGCFCGKDTEPSDYIEIQLRIAGSIATQYFGAHHACLGQALAPRFHVELEVDPEDF